MRNSRSEDQPGKASAGFSELSIIDWVNRHWLSLNSASTIDEKL